jgi:hypothetical protein
MSNPEFLVTTDEGENAPSSHLVMLIVPSNTNYLNLIPVQEREL